MASMERIASLILLSIILAVIVYPALPTSRVSVEIELKPLEEVSIIELRLGELSVHHYGARENNGRFSLLKEAVIKTSGRTPMPYHYTARIPYGSYDKIGLELLDAKIYVDGDEKPLDIRQGVIEKNFTVNLRDEAYLKVELDIDEGALLANHTLSMEIKVRSLK